MASDVKIESLRKAISKDATLFMQNGFRYSGKLLNSDENYVEILDYKSSKIKVLEIIEIKDFEILNVKNKEVKHE